ncbi:thrombospondin type 3 repeat-containing protein [Halomonas denitrificans]|nr:thrombospondin type 3 repeat-containing protein [Halomonas denitrificans]
MAVALLPILLSAQPSPDPQFDALERLRADSLVPVDVHFDEGAARSLRFDLRGRGSDEVEMARNFIADYADLFLQGPPRTNEGYDAVPESHLPVRAMRDMGSEIVVEFSQTIGGLPVVGANLAVSVWPDGHLRSASGVLLPRRPLALAPWLTRQEAEDAARNALDDPQASVAGRTHRVVFDPLIFGEPSDLRLAWSVVVVTGEAARVLIDALDGRVLQIMPVGFSGTRFLDNYDLYLQDANGGNIIDTNCFNPTTLDDFVGDETGIVPAYLNDPEASRMWWEWRKTYGFFENVFGRESFDGDGEEIESYIYSLPSDPSNGYGARYLATCGFEFMPGWVSFDVAAHEFAHGVIHYSSGLIYANQSGALNESFADLMGVIADAEDWLLAEDRTSGLGAIRNIADPLNGDCGMPSSPVACGDPDHMSIYCLSDDDCNFTGDNGGVHTNSGIPNKAHYLFAEGGTHGGIPVIARNRLKMARLLYHTFQILPPGATFMDARLTERSVAMSWAQQGIYGFNNIDVCSITNAWAAVGVGPSDVNCDLVLDGTVDTDGDGHYDEADNCPTVANVIQWDWDMDGLGDACDDDDDGDTCPDSLDNCPGVYLPCTGTYVGSPDSDGDGVGNACDEDDDNDGVLDVDDNCPGDPNPDQFDGDDNGQGDACDPDHDGDGLYNDADNCTFVANADQADTDGDGIGDACDDCPDVADNLLAYTPGLPALGIDPEPYQPDSDGDGIPDACDDTAFDTLALAFDGSPYNPIAPPIRGDRSRPMHIEGPAGSTLSVPISVCGDDLATLRPGQRVELVTRGLPDSVDVTITDQIGTRVARLGPAIGGMRGLWFTVDCRNEYRLEAALVQDLTPGVDVLLDLLDTQPNAPYPWGTPGAGHPAPVAIPDFDRDLQPNALDNCPLTPNADQRDDDRDGFGNACDRCDDSAPGPCEVLFDDGFEFRP